MKRSLIALALVAVLPLSAQADDKLSYTYVEGGYNYVDADGGAEADGFGVRGSFEFGESGFYGFGGYSQIEVDNVNVDIDSTELGLGYAHGLSDNLDLISEIAWNDIDVDGFGSEDGYRASIGLRGSFTDKFEGLVKANYNDGDNADGDFTGTIGAQYKFTQTWGLVGEATFGDNGEQYLVGLRASF
ncbi:MAG TPA: diffusible signal factor-reguated Ax21 family protein [Arenimonas sp.]|uniref:outer membrane beta-barrel protein n=1 Tax=Arenimonas sp. TaxID=1872635 RepID=UPI002D7E8450|nr:diffusible signal factor-reguated Ax21 faimly protein [Arenimonas sp.]HEU0154175.1 diffusible signal factor-reguated Ax21 family protein [Arenimonas sp.]